MLALNSLKVTDSDMNRTGPPIVKLYRLEVYINHTIMETKICKICGEEKPITEFNFRNKQKGTLMPLCKMCLHKRKNELYKERYKDRYKDRLKKNKQKHRNDIKQIIQKLKQSGCIICGEIEECCLDFHHLTDKEFGIACNKDKSKDKIIEEISKCVVLCSNCHRKLHAGLIRLPDWVRFDSRATNIVK